MAVDDIQVLTLKWEEFEFAITMSKLSKGVKLGCYIAFDLFQQSDALLLFCEHQISVKFYLPCG